MPSQSLYLIGVLWMQVEYPPSDKIVELQKELSKRTLAMCGGGIVLIWGLFNASDKFALEQSAIRKLAMSSLLLIFALFWDFAEFLCKYTMTTLPAEKYTSLRSWVSNVESGSRWMKVAAATIGVFVLAATLFAVVFQAFKSPASLSAPHAVLFILSWSIPR